MLQDRREMPVRRAYCTPTEPIIGDSACPNQQCEAAALRKASALGLVIERSPFQLLGRASPVTEGICRSRCGVDAGRVGPSTQEQGLLHEL